MRSTQASRIRWTAWLGVLALALNLLVPVHLAFDLVEALGPPAHEQSESGGDFGRRLIALVAWHHETGDDQDADHHHRGQHHDAACPVCSALGSLAALALPVAATLTLPVAAAAVAASLPPDARPVTLLPPAYRSRAPPFA